MYKRLLKLLKTNSFLLFGARGTGKTALLRDLFKREPAEVTTYLVSLSQHTQRVRYERREKRADSALHSSLA